MKQTWIGWLKTQRTPEARIMLTMGGKSVSATRSTIISQHNQGLICGETKAFRLDLLRGLERRFVARADSGDHPSGDWHDLGNGGFQRREHKGL